MIDLRGKKIYVGDKEVHAAYLGTEEFYRLPMVTLTNIVYNGDFRHGSDGWIFRRSTLMNDGTLIIGTGYDENQGTARVSKDLPLIKGNQYYIRVEYWPGSNSDEARAGFTYTYNDIASLKSTESAQSTIITNTFDTGNRDFGVGDDWARRVFEVKVKNIKIVDLTTDYGAGNEPSTLEVDEIISRTGYFEGSLSIT